MSASPLPAAVVPDQVQFACPACDITHWLLRPFDLKEAAPGVWRPVEASYTCDCGQPIHFDFTIGPAPPALLEPEPA